MTEYLREDLLQRKRYLRAKEAAKHLKIAKSTLWKWSKERGAEGFPQPIKAGERVTLFD